MTITAKTTKAEIRDYIEASSKKKAVKENIKLAGVIKKALELDIKKVKREDLVKVANAITKVLSTPASAQTVQAENSTKKLSKGVSKKQEVEDKDKKTDKKSSKKAKKAEDNAIEMAVNFPATLDVEGKTFELADDIKTMDDLYNAISNDEDIMFAYYWTKRHLKQFTYFGGWVGQPKSFDNDLDLATAIYISDEKKVAYQVSNYTEAIYTIIPTDLEVADDGIRYAGGIEFQIYRGVESKESTED